MFVARLESYAMKRTAAVLALILLASCSSSETQRDQLVAVLQKPDTAGLDQATAECVADEMIATAPDEVQSFIDEKPQDLDTYTAARHACDDIP